MKQISCLLIPLSLLFFFGSSQAQDNSTRLKISHLTGDFYVYTTYNPVNGKPYPSNSMYVVTRKGIILIDCPWDTTQFQPLLDSLEKKHHQKPVLCVATHYHDDRTAALDFFKQKGIATWSSAFTLQLCKTHNEKQAASTFTHDTTFRIGNHSFEAFYPGEGHTRDNIVIWFNKEKILYGGCLIKSTESSGLGNVADANVTEWPVSIKKIMQRYHHPAYIIPGHMGWANDQSLAHTLKLLQNSTPKK